MESPPDFFISYTKNDRSWAEWIAWTLEENGYKTLIQAWDFGAASNFVLEMQQGAAESARTIALISPNYFASAFTKPEWAAAFAADPKSDKGKLIPVRIANFEPPGLFKAIVYIDLIGMREDEAANKLLTSIGLILSGERLKPNVKPSFPQVARADRPAFPGAGSAPSVLIHNVPFAPNPLFTGREEALADLRKALQSNNYAALTQPQVVHGLGGVGKTQLAVEYAWRFKNEYQAILWITASSVDQFYVNVAGIARVLRLPEPETRDQESKIQTVIDWLRENDRWLLIAAQPNVQSSRRLIEDAKFELAQLLVETMQLEEADEICRQILEDGENREKIRPGTREAVLTIRARVLEYLGRFKEAESLYTEVISETEKNEMSSQATLAKSINNLANLMLTTRRFPAAEKLLRRALPLWENELGPKHPSLATPLSSLACCLHEEALLSGDNSRFDESEALHRRSLEIVESSYGREHLLYARVSNNLGWLLHDVGKLDEAEVLLQASLAIEQSKRHSNHPAIATGLSNLGRLMTTKRKFPEAVELLTRALSILTSSSELGKHNTAKIQANLAFALAGAEDHEGAERCFRAALKLDEACFGPSHVEVGNDLLSLGNFLVYQNRFHDAESFLQRAVIIHEKEYGLLHPRTENARYLLNQVRVVRLLNRRETSNRKTRK